jgi:hypothetical protein
MKVEIEIPAALIGYIKSLDVEEFEDDRILVDVGSSEHYYGLISYGLISALGGDGDEEDAFFLTHLGKIVHELKIIL